MNAITVMGDDAERRVISVMRESLYPGAREDSVRMVLSYCLARGLDPLLKPVHIVPMYVNGETRDVPLPGIALYRIQAARSGEYNGKSEPDFGPDVTRTFEGRDKKGNDIVKTITFPSWCKVTVKRGNAEFHAKEYWLENYATASRFTEVPNEMWGKRPYGQLAKCAEAQALRMAFPELTGGEPTAEEMEGKAHAEPREVPNMAAPEPRPAPAPVMDEPEFPWMTMQGAMIALPRDKWVKALGKALAALEDAGAVRAWRAERGAILAAIAENGDTELVGEAQRAIDLRVAQFEEEANGE